jgi:hypothetical protein
MGAGDDPAQHWGSRGHLSQYLREHSVADSTFQRYAHAFNHWKQWVAIRGLSWDLREASPAQIQLLSDFIIDCSLHGSGPTSPFAAVP